MEIDALDTMGQQHDAPPVRDSGRRLFSATCNALGRGEIEATAKLRAKKLLVVCDLLAVSPSYLLHGREASLDEVSPTVRAMAFNPSKC